MQQGQVEGANGVRGWGVPLPNGTSTQQRLLLNAWLAPLEVEGDVHARIHFIAARIGVRNHRSLVAFDAQRTVAVVVAHIQSFGSLNLQRYGVAAVRPRTDTAHTHTHTRRARKMHGSQLN